MELCVAAILRPCAHEMRLQTGLGPQEKFKSDQEASQEQSVPETTSEPPISPDNSAHNLMVTHVSVSAGLAATFYQLTKQKKNCD